ncbi:MAG TPA: choice-of-anchor E domain-containing protein [Phycisphaerales bacterium]|nr:choice-of-anchor E domain-containing protein [Phycisphaerales bacterium]
MVRGFVITAAVAALAGSAQAGFGQFAEQQSEFFDFALSPGAAVLTFDKFDTMGGTRELVAVEMSFIAKVSAAVDAENDSSIDAPNFGVNLAGFVNVNALSLAGTGTVSLTEFAAVGPTDGVVGSGPDFHDFGLLSQNTSDGDLAFLPAELLAFIGPGTFDANVDGSAGFAVTGSTDSTIHTTDFGAAGKVQVVYYYNLVPTPGAAALMGFAGLVGLRRRR